MKYPIKSGDKIEPKFPTMFMVPLIVPARRPPISAQVDHDAARVKSLEAEESEIKRIDKRTSLTCNPATRNTTDELQPKIPTAARPQRKPTRRTNQSVVSPPNIVATEEKAR